MGEAEHGAGKNLLLSAAVGFGVLWFALVITSVRLALRVLLSDHSLYCDDAYGFTGLASLLGPAYALLGVAVVARAARRGSVSARGAAMAAGMAALCLAGAALDIAGAGATECPL